MSLIGSLYFDYSDLMHAPWLRRVSFRSCSSSPSLFDPHHQLLQLLQLSITQPCLQLTTQLHSLITTLGLSQHSFLLAKLISSYSLHSLPAISRKLFDSIHPKNIFLYNSLINAYVRNQNFKDPFLLFNQLCTSRDVSPDNYTLSTILKACKAPGDLGIGEMVHCRCLKMGFSEEAVLGNSLMAMYSKCGVFADVRKVFDEMPQRSSISWNVLVSGFAGFSEDVCKVVRQMQVEGVRLNGYTVSSLLPLCGFGAGKWDYGREIHCVIVKTEMNVESDVHVGACLIDMYCKRKNVRACKRVFDRMNCRNVVVWTSMIAGYVQNGLSGESLVCFREMLSRDGIEPNRITLTTILPACNSLGFLMKGKQIHGFSIRKDYDREVALSNALIDMYSKCGNLDYARRVFNKGCDRNDIISWSSIISGYGLNGKGGEVISLYNEMIQLGIKPDNITLIGVLSSCARSGMVTEGLKIYDSAVKEHNVSPAVEVCACIVDMLARSGQIDKASEFVKTMPVKPGPSIWGSLFDASVAHGNSGMQELAYKSLIQLEPENPSNYVSLSNVYASLKRWDVVAELRKKMKGKGLRKSAGCSWITIGNETHSFYVADKTHPRFVLIYEMLDDLKVLMKGSGDNADFESMM